MRKSLVKILVMDLIKICIKPYSFFILFVVLFIAILTSSCENRKYNSLLDANKSLLDENRDLNDSLIKMIKVNNELQAVVSKIEREIDIESISFFKEYYILVKNISLGKDWIDQDNNQHFFRLVFSTIGEMGFIHLEKIKIGEEDGLTLMNREYLLPDIFYKHDCKLLKWDSPTIAEIYTSSKIYKIDLLSLSILSVADSNN